MSEPFNPYVDWLGLKLHELPPDHYRLLGLKRFSADSQAIVAAADQRMRSVRTHQTGPRGKFTQALLNELASAKLCLLDPASKAAYDAELRSQLAAGGSGPPLPPPSPPPLPAGMTIEAAESISTVEQLQAAISASEEQAKTASRGGRSSNSTTRWAAIILGVALLLAIVGGGVWAGMALVNTDPPTTADGDPLPTDDDGEPVPPPPPPPEVIVVGQEGDGGFQCSMAVAELQGGCTLESHEGAEAIAGFNGKEASAVWNLGVVRGGVFGMHLEYWAPPEAKDADFELVLAGNEPKMRSISPTEPGEISKDEFSTAIKRKGEQPLQIRVFGNGAEGVKLRSVRLSFRQ